MEQALKKLQQQQQDMRGAIAELTLHASHQQRALARAEQDRDEYMARYGVGRVRGGQYATPDLSNEIYNEAMRVCLHMHGLCNRCGRAGHTVVNCAATTYGRVAGGGPITGSLAA